MDAVLRGRGIDNQVHDLPKRYSNREISKIDKCRQAATEVLYASSIGRKKAAVSCARGRGSYSQQVSSASTT